MHQIAGGVRRKVIGTFQVAVHVKAPNALLPVSGRRLAVFKHIGLSIPVANRWRLIWDRLLQQEADKVRGLGGDPDKIPPSPHGYDGPDGHDHPPGQPPADGGAEDGREKVLTGKVERVYYDCFGKFEGFELRSCAGSVFLPACDRAFEQIALRACRFDLLLMVWVVADRKPKPDYEHVHDHEHAPQVAVVREAAKLLDAGRLITAPVQGAERATLPVIKPRLRLRIVRIAIGCC